MRLTKMFGLAAFAAVAATAFLGASSASATSTVLCKVNELVCPAGSKIEHATVTALATHVLILTNVANILCTHSVFSATVLLLANPLVFHNVLTDYTGCSESVLGTKCSIVTNNAGLLKLLKDEPNGGGFLEEGKEALVNCASLGIHCVYGGPTVSVPFKGSVGTGLGTVSLSNVPLPKKSGGFFCPSSTSVHALYTITSPDPAYVAE